MTAAEYIAAHPNIVQDSEKLFVEDFLYPLLGDAIERIQPQRPFVDRSGRTRRIDFAYADGANTPLALEVNGETYHAEGVISNEMFDDNLYRQNEILSSGYALIRFSYSQLQSPVWRPLVMDSLRSFFQRHAPELLSSFTIEPNEAQREALQALAFYRETRGWNRGVVVLPTGTGKTVMSAMDSFRVGGRTLFVVHRLDILAQSIDAFKLIKPTVTVGLLTGESRDNEHDCEVLFASKDTLRRPEVLAEYEQTYFDYVIIDEVHHGQSPSYRELIEYFRPRFMLGMTATPDRTDRQDILELFDYRKVYELTLGEAIDRGMLVPYTYIGLTDDVDYTKIRFQNNRYRVDDLERALIIPERNRAILQEYIEKGGSNKAIGFCVSIRHAERMSEYFNELGIVAAAIHSQSANREADLKLFRDNKIQVVFTVDLFNEGIDIPNVQTLLFLRPTESKTVFLQQLGRGLRLCPGKERVTILDFIGNYKRANQVRKYLAESSRVEETKENGRSRKKLVYSYSTGCEVLFDAEVEEILTRQDSAEIEVTREDLKEAYFALSERLSRKPTKADLDSSGEFKSIEYIREYGTWLAFLRDIGEYTEASFAYPQGVHVGHLLAILHYFGRGDRSGSPFADEYVAMRGGLGEGRLAAYRRQIKYKLQAAMEFGILTDDRTYQAGEVNPLVLTPLGSLLYNGLKPLLADLDLTFPLGSDGIPSTRMTEHETHYNGVLRDFIEKRAELRAIVVRCFLSVPAVQQMFRFIYQVCRSGVIRRAEIYEQFSNAPFVQQYCDQEGIEPPTEESARHRCPFLLNILAALGAINPSRDEITVCKLILTPTLVQVSRDDDPPALRRRLDSIAAGWPTDTSKIEAEDLTAIRELFGPLILTAAYPITQLEVFEEE